MVILNLRNFQKGVFSFGEPLGTFSFKVPEKYWKSSDISKVNLVHQNPE
jgi:hypothetical protein